MATRESIDARVLLGSRHDFTTAVQAWRTDAYDPAQPSEHVLQATVEVILQAWLSGDEWQVCRAIETAHYLELAWRKATQIEDRAG